MSQRWLCSGRRISEYGSVVWMRVSLKTQADTPHYLRIGMSCPDWWDLKVETELPTR